MRADVGARGAHARFVGVARWCWWRACLISCQFVLEKGRLYIPVFDGFLRLECQCYSDIEAHQRTSGVTASESGGVPLCALEAWALLCRLTALVSATRISAPRTAGETLEGSALPKPTNQHVPTPTNAIRDSLLEPVTRPVSQSLWAVVVGLSQTLQRRANWMVHGPESKPTARPKSSGLRMRPL
jgi:hypothetical protein